MNNAAEELKATTGTSQSGNAEQITAARIREAQRDKIANTAVKEPYFMQILKRGAEAAAASVFDSMEEEQAKKIADAARNGQLQFQQSFVDSVASAVYGEISKAIKTATKTIAGAANQQPESIEEFKAQLSGAGDLATFFSKAQTINKDKQAFVNAMAAPIMAGIRQIFTEALEELNRTGQLKQALNSIGDFFGSPSWEDANEKLFYYSDLLPRIMEMIRQTDGIEAYLAAELKNTDYKFSTVEELTEQLKTGISPELAEHLLKAIEAAWKDKEKRENIKYRTTATAGETEKINFNRLAVTTAIDYLNAVSMNESGLAFMRGVEMEGLRFEDGKLYFTNDETNQNDIARALTEVELKNLATRESIQSINLPFLQFYYTHLFHEWEDAIRKRAEGKEDVKINAISTFYLPDIAAARGLSKNTGTESVDAIKNDIAAFHNIVGVLKEKGRREASYYPVLNFEGYNAINNTISFSSPYLLHVVEKIYKLSVRRKKDGTPLLRNDGTPQTLPVNSYLVHSDIMKERNKAAVQNVFIIVQGVERCGDNEYSISAETLIERNPILQQQLNTNQNERRLLQKVFSKTWELLRSKTDLATVYKNIKLPDPKNPEDIPTKSTLKKFVLTITHDGKKPGDNASQ